MPKLKCPKCSSEIVIPALPPDRKVSCTACQASFVIKLPNKPTPKAPTSLSGANDPFALPGQDLGGPDLGGLDLGGFPAAPGQAAGLSGGYGVPMGYSAAAPTASSSTKSGGKSKSKTKSKSGGSNSKTGLYVAIGVLVVLLLGGTIAGAIALAGGKSKQAMGDRPKIQLPPFGGWEGIKLKGVYGIMPAAGEGEEESIPGSFNGKVRYSSTTESLYLFGVMDAISGDANEEKCCKAARSLLGGDVLPGGAITVNGYAGFRGTYSVGVFLPDRTMIQMFPLEDRFIVRGYLAKSARMSNSGGDAMEVMKVDTQKETEEFKYFDQALYVGPKPGFFSK